MHRFSDGEQKALWEIAVAALLLAAFLLIACLSLWPLGQLALVLRLVEGYALFWLTLALTWWLLSLFHRLARIESDPPSSAYILSNLALSAFLQMGWSAFAVLTISYFLTDTLLWHRIVLHSLGIFSSLVASVMVGVFYQGTIYKIINGPLALLSYLAFALWPVLARAIYGWFFRFF